MLLAIPLFALVLVIFFTVVPFISAMWVKWLGWIAYKAGVDHGLLVLSAGLGAIASSRSSKS